MKITWANVSFEKAVADKITQRVIDSKWTARWFTESMVDAEVVDNIKEMDEIMRRRPSQLELYQWTPTTTTTIGRWSTNYKEVEDKKVEHKRVKYKKVEGGNGLVRGPRAWSQWYGLEGPVDL